MREVKNPGRHNSRLLKNDGAVSAAAAAKKKYSDVSDWRERARGVRFKFKFSLSLSLI